MKTEDKWIRAHVSEVFNYEEEAEGIDLSDQDYPEYGWDIDILSPNLVGSNSNSINENDNSSTNYIQHKSMETKIYRQKYARCVTNGNTYSIPP